MGVYEMVPDFYHNGRRVWKQAGGENFIFHTGNTYWIVGSNIEKLRGGIVIYDDNRQGFLMRDGWMYWDWTKWTSDDVTIEATEGVPDFPNAVSIFSDGPAAKKIQQIMGVYNIGHNDEYLMGRPIWKHQDDEIYIFHDGKEQTCLLVSTLNMLVLVSYFSIMASWPHLDPLSEKFM